MIKKVIAYLLSWTFFWMGDITCKIMEYTEQWWLYSVYNRLMWWSSDIQTWADNETPWSPVSSSEYEDDDPFRCTFWKDDV
jgi:hypothetical protein